jgi:hypothetical protein
MLLCCQGVCSAKVQQLKSTMQLPQVVASTAAALFQIVARGDVGKFITLLCCHGVCSAEVQQLKSTMQLPQVVVNSTAAAKILRQQGNSIRLLCCQGVCSADRTNSSASPRAWQATHKFLPMETHPADPASKNSCSSQQLH